MKISKILSTTGLTLLGLGALVMVFAAGCQSQASASASAASGQKGGAQLWTQNCLPCHNVRSPSQYSDADWDVIMQHMRVRANLAASDAETIAKFLKSAN